MSVIDSCSARNRHLASSPVFCAPHRVWVVQVRLGLTGSTATWTSPEHECPSRSAPLLRFPIANPSDVAAEKVSAAESPRRDSGRVSSDPAVASAHFSIERNPVNVLLNVTSIPSATALLLVALAKLLLSPAVLQTAAIACIFALVPLTYVFIRFVSGDKR